MKIFLGILFSTIIGLTASDNRKLATTYINNYKDVAVQEMHRTGIPASIKLAQGLLESDWGRSDLATTANNHFGIKCGGTWSGGTFYKEDDDKDDSGRMIESCFRSFASPTESYMAHSDFLTDPKKAYRYGFLFTYSADDYKAWAKGLKKSGYATDPSYPAKLIQIIETYDLHQYDSASSSAFATAKSPKRTRTTTKPERVSLANRSTPTDKKSKNTTRSTSRTTTKHISRLQYSIETTNDCRMVTAKGGETLAQLARSVGLSEDELLVINEVYTSADATLDQGSQIFLEKKKRNYKGIQAYHIVAQGESMESISQLYGIRLKSLFAKNRMPKGSKAIVGARLALDKTVSLSERPKFELADSNRKHKFLFDSEDD